MTNYARKARSFGWVFDKGGRHWFLPSPTPLMCHGRYAKTAREAVEMST